MSDGPESQSKAGGFEDVPPPPVKKPRFTILTLDQLLQRPTPDYLIDGVLTCRALGELHGPPKTGKTFIVLGMSLSVATGTPWCDRPVRQGPVLYVITEGASAMPLRVRAWFCETPDAAWDAAHRNFYCLPNAVQVLQGEIADLIAAIEAIGITPVLIIIDTLARCFAGGDENTVKDMSAFIRACDELRDRFDATVLVVHHSGKNNSSERGSSALRGAVDAMYATERDKKTGVITLRCEKQKDGEECDDLYFKLVTEFLGVDGQRILSSCRVERTDPPERGSDGEAGSPHGEASVGKQVPPETPLEPVPPRKPTTRELVLQALRAPESAAGVSVSQLSNVIDKSRSSLSEAVRRLVLARQAEHDEKQGLYYLFGHRPKPDSEMPVQQVSSECPAPDPAGHQLDSPEASSPEECPVHVQASAPPLKGAPGSGLDTGWTPPAVDSSGRRKRGKSRRRKPTTPHVGPEEAADAPPTKRKRRRRTKARDGS